MKKELKKLKNDLKVFQDTTHDIDNEHRQERLKLLRQTREKIGLISHLQRITNL